MLAELKDFDFEAKFTVKSFQMTCVTANGDSYQAQIQGNKLNKDQRDIIQNLQPGAKVIFENILSKGPAPKLYSSQLVVTIK